MVFIDYGNHEITSFSKIRPLAPQFKTLEPQAKEATLSFIRLLGNETEYGVDALERFRDLCEVCEDRLGSLLPLADLICHLVRAANSSPISTLETKTLCSCPSLIPRTLLHYHHTSPLLMFNWSEKATRTLTRVQGCVLPIQAS